MSYYISKTVDFPYAEAIERTKEKLKEQGFGVITEIDMKAVLKNKIDKDIAPYIILGACNPKHAFNAVQTEENIGLMLPCNVVVREGKDGKVNVSVIDPMEAMKPVENPNLEEMASQVRASLMAVIQNL
jgi:uncharacterized protein (DUF302 family)